MKKHKILIMTVLVIIVLLIFSLILVTLINLNPTGNVIENNKEVYKIGVIVPLTGPGSNLGPAFANGMKIAVDEVNKNGGINNKELNIYIEDGKFDSKESINAANYLLNIKDPDIFSVIFHLPIKTVSPILRENKKPLVYESFTRSILEENPYAFKSHFDALTGCQELAEYIKYHQKNKKLGILTANTEYGNLCIQGVKKANPEVIVYKYEFGDTDFKTILTKATNNKIDNLIFIGIDFEFIALFKQLTELGYPIKVACATASECIFKEVIDSSSEEVLDGTIAIDVIPMDLKKSDFTKKYTEKYGMPSATALNFAAVGYEEIQYISKAMENCKPGDFSCLIKSLKNVKDYNTLIKSNGFKNRVLQLTTNIYEYQNGEWVLLQ